MEQISQLIALVTSPYGLIGGFIVLFAISKAKQSRPVAWFLLTLLGFCASLGKFVDEWNPEPPALVFPLQQLRDAGRPLSVVLLLALLYLAVSQNSTWRSRLLAKPLILLCVVQALIAFKLLLYGSAAFAVLAAGLFLGIIQMVRLGPSRWLSDETNFRLGVQSIAGVGMIFVLVNAYQAAINIYPLTFIQGRLSGTTGNAQHAAVLLSTTMPAILFWFELTQQKFMKVVLLLSLAMVSVALLMTGSRTGIIMGLSSFFLFYARDGKALFRFGIIALVAAILAMLFAGESIDAFFANQSDVVGRLASTENTREQVWGAMWRQFNNNILFGAPLRGDRIGFGESSWLATAANLGLMGLIPLLCFGWFSIKMIIDLYRISKFYPAKNLHCSVVIAGLSCLLVGSFSEAFLLGNLTFALIALLIYLSLGQYLIELSEFQSRQYYQALIANR